MNTTQMQYRAFLATIVAALVVALSPVFVAGVRGVSLPEPVIAIADKSTSGFLALLGAVGALLFRQSGLDEKRVDNTGEALAAIREAQRLSPGPDAAADGGRQVADAAADEARSLAGGGVDGAPKSRDALPQPPPPSRDDQ